MEWKKNVSSFRSSLLSLINASEAIKLINRAEGVWCVVDGMSGRKNQDQNKTKKLDDPKSEHRHTLPSRFVGLFGRCVCV